LNIRKNQNSILVLATLGVYLGLALAGATPQVLAQAAMTRQFDVTDEIEVSDNVDKKPGDALNDLQELSADRVDAKIAASLERFFGKSTIDSFCGLCAFERTGSQPLYFRSALRATANRLESDVPLRQKVTLTNFPRADLDSPLASIAE